MKKVFHSLAAMTLLAAGVVGSSPRAKAQCYLNIDPNNNAASITIYSPFAATKNFDPHPAVNPAAFIDQVISSVSPVVTPGQYYLGWCVDTVDDINWGPITYGALLYSSCDPNLDTYLLNAGYTGTVDASAANWNAVNYLLNHKNGADFWTFQNAIWNFVGGPVPDPAQLPGYPTYDPTVLAALIADANANAASWVAKCGDVIAVVVLAPGQGSSDTTRNQLTIIEVPVPCTPAITITKEVACLQPGDNCGSFSKLAEGFKGLTDPAFCYQITISNAGSMNLTNVLVTDSLLAGDITTNFFPSGTNFLAPGQSATAILKMSVDTTTTNTATVTALSLNADSSAGSSITNSDTAVAIVDTAAVTCSVALSSPSDTDGIPNDGHLTLPSCSNQTSSVTFTVTIANAGASSLTGVTLTSAAFTAMGGSLPAPFDLAVGASKTFSVTKSLTCSNMPTLNVSVIGKVGSDNNHCGIYDLTSSNVVSVSSSCSGSIDCAPCNCTSSVCGYVFRDCNGDGILSPGIDVGVSNIVVTLKNGKIVIATITTDRTGAYCFSKLNPGTYTVCINQPANCVQTAGCHVKHWNDNNNNDCWYENDGYQHCKGSDGVDRWTSNDGCKHYKNSYGQDCWKDRWGLNHTQNCNYTSCNVPKGNCENFTLGTCENKTCVNFSYQGVAPKATCTVTGPTRGVCGQTLTYTCTVSNDGNACFTACQVSACGKNYNCPSLRPGEKCSFQFNYTCKTSDYGNFKCNANASCNYSGSSNPCSSQGGCYTQISYH